jgi:hypothetical protein
MGGPSDAALAQARDGHPGAVRTKGKGGILRVNFGEPEEGLEPVEWEEFFKIFDDNNLAFLRQDKASNDKPSRFNAHLWLRSPPHERLCRSGEAAMCSATRR